MKTSPLDVPVSPGGIVAGKYRVDAVIGFGGIGIVCEGFHLDLQAKVEVQIGRRDQGNDENSVAKVLSEIRSASQLRSQHTRRILDCGRLDVGAPYMVVEHLDGADLRHVRGALQRLPAEEAVSLVLQACESLGEAHSRGIVHGALTLEHLFLTHGPDGGALVKVLDLGISSPARRNDATAVDARTDISSLGGLLHELLTGKVPISLSDVDVGLPDSLAAVVLRCMKKNVDARFSDAAALGRALRPFGGTSSLARERVEEILRRAQSFQPESETSPSIAAAPEPVADQRDSVADMPASVVDVPDSVPPAPETVADAHESTGEQRDSVVDMPASVVDLPDSDPPPPLRSISALPVSSASPPPLPASPSEPAAARSVPAGAQSVPAGRPSQATKPPPLPPSQSPPSPVLMLPPALKQLVEKRSTRLALAGVLLGSVFGLLVSRRSDPVSGASSATAASQSTRVTEPAPRVVGSAPRVEEPAPRVIDLDEPEPLPSAAPVAAPAPPPRAPTVAREPTPEPIRVAAPRKPAESTTPASESASRPARKKAWSPFPELKQPVLPPHVQ